MVLVLAGQKLRQPLHDKDRLRGECRRLAAAADDAWEDVARAVYRWGVLASRSMRHDAKGDANLTAGEAVRVNELTRQLLALCGSLMREVLVQFWFGDDHPLG